MENNLPTNTLKGVLNSDAIKQGFVDMLGKNAASFITSVLSVVKSNDKLQKADKNSVVFAAATAASLNLAIDPNLGFAYIVPYNTKQQDGSFKQMAQFQIGYRGQIQLCMRTGQFKSLGSKAVFEGQYVINETFEGFHFDWAAKKSETVIGYASNFELMNGFSKTFFMTVEELKNHGSRFSKTYKFGLWKKDFDAMAKKTVLKLLLGKYAPMSIETPELLKAQRVDQAVINDFEAVDISYIDNEPAPPIDQDAVDLNHSIEKLKKVLETIETVPDLDELALQIGDEDELKNMIQTKRNEFNGKA